MLVTERSRFLKEWSPVVDALGNGTQTILIRKYPPTHNDFFLYPTYSFSIVEDYLARCFQEDHHDFVRRSAKSKKPGKVEIRFHASATEILEVKKKDLKKFRRLVDHFIWSVDHVLNYLETAKKACVWVLRTRKLPSPRTIDDLRRGSIIYAYMSASIPTAGSISVIDDTRFQSMTTEIKETLAS